MKKLMLALAAAVTVAIVGCKTIPSTDKMYVISEAIGFSTGMVVNETKVDDATRNAIVEIMGIVCECVPETNQTFEAAWTPIAKAHTQKLIDDGKITEQQGTLIMAGFGLVAKGIDYIFEVRYPEAKQYKDLVCAAIDGFSNGFLTVFKPVNVNSAKRGGSFQPYDPAAYDYLKRDARKMKRFCK